MPCKFDSTGSTYFLRNSLAPHCQFSRKKTHVCEKLLLSVKDGRTNTGEKSFAYTSSVKASRHKDKVIQHQTIQTLRQAFKYNECGKDFLEKTTIATPKSTHPKVKSYKFNKFGENQCDKSTLIVSQSNHPEEKSHYEFSKYECTENGNNFSRNTQRTDTEGESFSQKLHIREQQKINLGVKPFEYGKNFSHNSALPVLQQIHAIDQSSDYDTCTETLGYQSTFSVHHRTPITVKPCECLFFWSFSGHAHSIWRFSG